MTNFYVPDEWVVLKIDGNPLHYKILAGWKETYLEGSSWRLNSGVVLAEKDGDWLLFHGHSGSVYRCHKRNYGLGSATGYIFDFLKKNYGDKVTVLGSEHDWTTFDWNVQDAKF